MPFTVLHSQRAPPRPFPKSRKQWLPPGSASSRHACTHDKNGRSGQTSPGSRTNLPVGTGVLAQVSNALAMPTSYIKILNLPFRLLKSPSGCGLKAQATSSQGKGRTPGQELVDRSQSPVAASLKHGLPIICCPTVS